MDIVRQLVEKRPTFFDNRIAYLDKVIAINDFIDMSYGLSNAYMVKTANNRVIINTGMGLEAPVHKRIFDAACSLPTPYILLTQGHVDHVGGVSLFREADTKLIANCKLADCQADDARIKQVREAQAYIWFRQVFDSIARDSAAPQPAIVQDVPLADITFDDSYSFAVDGLQLKLYSVPGGETLDSVAIWLPDHQILFSGNMFGPLFPHFPNFNTIRGDRYRDVESYLSSLRRVRELEPEMLITGHFDPVVGKDLIRTCLDRLGAAVEYVHTKTLRGMNSGNDIWTLMREVQLPEECYVGQGYGKVSWAVRTIWENYMGWFKGQWTSELYATRPVDIYPDLVQLGGIDAVITEGRRKLEGGDPERANLLAEAALAANGNHRRALALSLDVHRALLQRGGGINFWETGWLTTKIEELQGILERGEPNEPLT